MKGTTMHVLTIYSLPDDLEIIRQYASDDVALLKRLAIQYARESWDWESEDPDSSLDDQFEELTLMLQNSGEPDDDRIELREADPLYEDTNEE